MRERVGIVFGISGCILLLQPDINGSEILAQVQEAIWDYWPLGLIALGFFLMNPKRKGTRSRR